MLRKILSSLILGALSLTSASQITGHEWEIVQVHYGDYGDGYDLTEYVTHRLWLTFESEEDFLSAIWGAPQDNCDEADSQDISFEFDCGLFQHEDIGTAIGDQQTACLFGDLFPSAIYDSFVTIGTDCQSDGCLVFSAAVCPPATVWEDQFEGPDNGDYFDGGDLWVDDGAWFSTVGTACGYAGDDLKVLVAQFTTCGDIDYCFSAQCFIGGVGTDTMTVNYCNTEPNPCTNIPLDPFISILDDIDCFGELAAVQVGDLTGNGDINLELYDVLDPLNPIPQLNDNVFTGLMEGDYYVALEDAFGCRDTSAVFSLVEPDTLEFSADLVSDVLCHGDETGEICFTVVGGTEPYTIELLETGETLTDDGCFDELGCGDFTIQISDGGTCVESETFSVSCPDDLIYAITPTQVDCNGANNGELNGTVDGGSGDITFTWTYPDASTIEMVGEDPLDVSIANLTPGEHVFEALDTNGCSIMDSYLITEPTPIITQVNFTDASCFGFCDGTIDVDAAGGTGALDTECELLGGGAVDPNAVCAGDYVCVTTDDNGCMVSDTLTIDEPDEITYTLIINPASCFDECDGSIFVQDLAGGSGNIELALTPDGTFVNDPPDNVGWTDLCPDDPFTITFTDLETGCVITEENIQIEEPEELLLNIVTSDINCFGDDNGIIDIACAGGTGVVQIISPEITDCPATLTDLPPGNYTVTIEDESGCQVSQEVTLTQPDVLDIGITDTFPVSCGGGCDGIATYTVDGGTEEYTILLGGQIIQPVDLITLCAQDDYLLSVIDMNGCVDTTTFSIIEPEPIEILSAVENVTCTGMCDGSINVFAIGGVPPIELEFSNSELDPEVLCEGSYPVMATDSTGCTVQDTINVFADIVTDLQVEIFTTPLTCWNTMDGTATAAVTGGNPPIYFQWSDPNGQNTSTAVGLDEEVYFVTITDDLGCTIDTMALIEPNVGCFFISTALTPNGDGANDEWLIGGLEYFPLAEVQVYNRWGQLLYESVGYSVPWDGRHNGKKLPASDYYFIIKYDEAEELLTGSVTLKY